MITLDIVVKELNQRWVSEDSELIEDSDSLWLCYTQMSHIDSKLILTKGKGASVKDINNKVYIDGQGGLWCVNIGHGNPEIIFEIWKQTTNICYYTLFGSSHIPAIKLAKKLVEITPIGLNHVFFSSGGADAIESAIKIVISHFKNIGKKEKRKLLFFEGGFHGETLGALSISGCDDERLNYLKENPDLIKLPYPSHEDFKNNSKIESYILLVKRIIEKIGKEEIAALIYEPIQGVGGCKIPSKRFYDSLQQILGENGILQIVDEVTTGFGRTGKLFACNHYDINPDIIVFSKGLSSAYSPIGAAVMTDEIYNSFLEDNLYLKHGYTLGGHPIACAAAMKNIELIMNENFLKEVVNKGRYIFDKLNAMKSEFKFIKSINGIGLMNFIHLQDHDQQNMSQIESRKICNLAQHQGLLIRSLDNLIPLMPPLCISNKEIDEMISILYYSFEEYQKCLKIA